MLLAHFVAPPQVVDIDDEGFISLMLDSGETKDDIQLKPDDEADHQSLMDDFQEGKDLLATVLAACGEEKIISYKEIKE